MVAAVLALAFAVIAQEFCLRAVRADVRTLRDCLTRATEATGVARDESADMRALRDDLTILTRRVDTVDGALTIEVLRLDEIESELSAHTRDPIGILSRPPRI